MGCKAGSALAERCQRSRGPASWHHPLLYRAELPGSCPCDGRRSQSEEGTKAVHSDPRHDSYSPLRQSTVHCIFKTVLVLLCGSLTRRWSLGPHLEGGNQSSISCLLGMKPSAGSNYKLLNFLCEAGLPCSQV